MPPIEIPAVLLVAVMIFSELRSETIKRCRWLIPGLPTIIAMIGTIPLMLLMAICYALSKTSIFD